MLRLTRVAATAFVRATPATRSARWIFMPGGGSVRGIASGVGGADASKPSSELTASDARSTVSKRRSADPSASANRQRIIVSSDETWLPIHAHYRAHHINTGKLVNELFGPGSEGVHRSRESVLVTMDMGGKLVPFAAESLVSQRMAVLHDFGSVVFVNYNEGERAEFLRLIRPYLTNPVAEPVVEEYAVVVSSSIGSLCELTPECLIVQRLDKETLTVIASPLAQTVALEHYENRVDAMVETFLALNAEVGRTGTLNMQRRELFSLVASNNFVLTECVSTLGVLDRSETAWRFARLDPIWELVRSEFDLKERFATLDFRLSQIQHNTRFFLEMQQSSKSNMLEIIVICLLSVEIVLTLLDLYQNRIEEARLLELEKTASSED